MLRHPVFPGEGLALPTIQFMVRGIFVTARLLPLVTSIASFADPSLDGLDGQPCGGKERTIKATCETGRDGSNSIRSAVACIGIERCYAYPYHKLHGTNLGNWGGAAATNDYIFDPKAAWLGQVGNSEAARLRCGADEATTKSKGPVCVKMEPDHGETIAAGCKSGKIFETKMPDPKINCNLNSEVYEKDSQGRPTKRKKECDDWDLQFRFCPSLRGFNLQQLGQWFAVG